MVSDPEVLRRLDELEERLNDYCDHLEAALERDRQFQLDATWGVVSAVLGLGALAVLLTTGNLWLNGASWPWWILAWIAYAILAVLIVGAIAAWIEKKRKQDAAKLSKLPKWRSGRGR